ncbi:hypothetical protein FACS1894111_10490 [Clostridia bacterium]|nr:hypothetical protein FACS1894111_10490 [Clostridia bacterium]
MKGKKFLALLLGVTTILGTAVIPVAAQALTENFHVYHYGGAVVSSNAAQKEDTSNYMGFAVDKRYGTTVNWVTSETVYLRGRTSGGTQCTSLASVNQPASGAMTYASGYATYGSYYRLAVQYADANPYTHLDLTASWAP